MCFLDWMKRLPAKAAAADTPRSRMPRPELKEVFSPNSPFVAHELNGTWVLTKADRN